MKSSARFIALGGSRRHYYDVQRRQVMSRRQYLKLQGIFPTSRRVGTSGRVRSDKGCIHQPAFVGTDRAQPFVKHITLSDGHTAEIHPVGDLLYRVMIRSVQVAHIQVEQCGTRRKWTCAVQGCSFFERNQEAMAHHCYQMHFSEFSRAVGRPPEKVWYTGEVRTNERRARFPWQVPAQSRRPFFGKG